MVFAHETIPLGSHPWSPTHFGAYQPSDLVSDFLFSCAKTVTAEPTEFVRSHPQAGDRCFFPLRHREAGFHLPEVGENLGFRLPSIP